jgi:uncharacterized membrane-anchored protein
MAKRVAATHVISSVIVIYCCFWYLFSEAPLLRIIILIFLIGIANDIFIYVYGKYLFRKSSQNSKYYNMKLELVHKSATIISFALVVLLIRYIAPLIDPTLNTLDLNFDTGARDPLNLSAIYMSMMTLGMMALRIVAHFVWYRSVHHDQFY